ERPDTREGSWGHVARCPSANIDTRAHPTTTRSARCRRPQLTSKEEGMRPRTVGASTVLMISVAAAANGQAPTASPATVVQPGAVPAPAATQAPTPRDADGHPILAGLWTGPNPGAPPNVVRNGPDFNDFIGRGGSFEGFEEDGGLLY